MDSVVVDFFSFLFYESPARRSTPPDRPVFGSAAVAPSEPLPEYDINPSRRTRYRSKPFVFFFFFVFRTGHFGRLLVAVGRRHGQRLSAEPGVQSRHRLPRRVHQPRRIQEKRVRRTTLVIIVMAQ